VVLRQYRDLSANIFGTKRALKKLQNNNEGLYLSPKLGELWLTRRARSVHERPSDCNCPAFAVCL